MDFVADSLFNSRWIRALTMVDNFSCERLASNIDHSIGADKVVWVMKGLKHFVGRVPDRIQVDNGAEFICNARQVGIWDSRPGKPTDNTYIESFIGSFRDECLSAHWFLLLDEAREKIETWRRDYNGFRPHSALDNMTPEEYVKKHLKKPESLIYVVQLWCVVQYEKLQH